MNLLEHDSGLPALHAGGAPRALAALPSPREHRVPAFASRYATLPRSAWQPRDVRWLELGIWDQGQIGACGGFGACRQFAIAHRLAGHAPRKFSPWFVYASVNGGFDRGSVVSDLMETIQANGVCLDEQVPNGEFLLSRIGAEARKTARRFRARECYALANFDEACTAWQLGCAVGIGIDVGTRFQPDAEGFLPDQRGQAGGHYMGTEGMLFARGQWWLIVANSWTAKWGKNGYCFLPESYLTNAWFEGFAVRDVTDDPEDPADQPPAAP